MLNEIAGEGSSSQSAADAAAMDARIAAKRAEVQRAEEQVSANERSQQNHDQQKALHERKHAAAAAASQATAAATADGSVSAQPIPEDPLLRKLQAMIADKRGKLQAALDEAERRHVSYEAIIARKNTEFSNHDSSSNRATNICRLDFSEMLGMLSLTNVILFNPPPHFRRLFVSLHLTIRTQSRRPARGAPRDGDRGQPRRGSRRAG